MKDGDLFRWYYNKEIEYRQKHAGSATASLTLRQRKIAKSSQASVIRLLSVNMKSRKHKMGNIHDVFKDDETSGTIIGGNYVCGYLFYGERKALYRQLWADSEGELQQKAKEEKQRLLCENSTQRSLEAPFFLSVQ